ncbi:RNA polymerase sigma factor [Undibacterium sp. Di24W]|uniref:RNA polymerase sigma factor n=1 Tax=Undibacterium sp. Di24W TaxID=3413033 RepID=UPI003BF11A84
MDDLISDTELIRQMRNGDKSAFTALYRRHQAALYRYAVLRCGSNALAADVVQDVFMGLMTDQYKYDALRGQLRYFLFGVARNVAMKHDSALQKTASAMNELEDDDPLDEVICENAAPLERLMRDRMAEDLRQAIASLAMHYRDVLILYEMHEMSYLEIADICQINVGTVRSRLSRARLALAERLSQYRSACAVNGQRA